MYDLICKFWFLRYEQCMDFYSVYVLLKEEENFLFSYAEKHKENLDKFYNIHLIQEFVSVTN